jgi:hypothetical protein
MQIRLGTRSGPVAGDLPGTRTADAAAVCRDESRRTRSWPGSGSRPARCCPHYDNPFQAAPPSDG